jgi:hypothetical protein
VLRIVVRAGEEAIPEFNEFIRRYTLRRYRRAVAESVVLAAFELLENGVAYGSVSSPVIFELGEQGTWTFVRVQNMAIAARSGRLIKLLSALSADAKAVYDGEIQRSVRGPTRGQLGLARVAHEAAMQIWADVDQDRVIVTAYRST